MEIYERFRGFLPVVVDLETGGVEPEKNAILEICMILPSWKDNTIDFGATHEWTIAPHDDTTIDEASMQINRIDISDPNRSAVSEEFAIRECFKIIRQEIDKQKCSRAIMTAHNAHFDHAFIKYGARRNGIGRNPFHKFSVVDTVGLAAVTYGQTVLRRACEVAAVPFDETKAHGARYDAEATARLFFAIVNRTNYSEFSSSD